MANSLSTADEIKNLNLNVTPETLDSMKDAVRAAINDGVFVRVALQRVAMRECQRLGEKPDRNSVAVAVNRVCAENANL